MILLDLFTLSSFFFLAHPAARQHPLSIYTPQCPHCALTLCAVNPPTVPCPSCSHHPLLAAATSAAHLATLHDSRDALLAREVARAAREKEQAALERAAIRFPELGGAGGAPAGGVPQVRGYSDMAGGGRGAASLSQRIEAAYETGVSVNGNQFGRKPVAVAQPPPTAGKVLRLDTKTKKVKVVTTTVKPKATASQSAAMTLNATGAVAGDDDDDDDGLVAWLDPHDDGLADTLAAAAQVEVSTDKARPFRNPQFEISWVEYAEPEVEEDHYEEEGGWGSGPRVVPGAAKTDGAGGEGGEGGKKARKRGKPRKGDKSDKPGSLSQV